VTGDKGESDDVSERVIFETHLPVSVHKEALQVVLPEGLTQESKLKETAIPLSYSLPW
jgi:hypothetical protein